MLTVSAEQRILMAVGALAQLKGRLLLHARTVLDAEQVTEERIAGLMEEALLHGYRSAYEIARFTAIGIVIADTPLASDPVLRHLLLGRDGSPFERIARADDYVAAQLRKLARAEQP